MEYQPLTLPISKEVVLIQPVSPILLGKVRRKYPPPSPPVQKVNLGTNEAPIWEEEVNEAHPDYLEARQQWALMLEERVREFALKMGVRIEWTDEKLNALAELREKMADLDPDMVDMIEEDNTIAFVSYVAIKSSEDYNALLRAIMEGVRPSEEAIEAAVATFRPESNGVSPDLQGKVSL